MEPTETPAAEPTIGPAADASVRPGTIYTTQGTLLPGGEFSVQFGVEYLEDGQVRLRTNADGQPESKYSQAITQVISRMWVELDAESYWRIFTSESAEAPSSQVILLVDPQNAESAGLTQDRRDGNLFHDAFGNDYRTGDSYNNGFASFYGMTLRGDLEAGEYEQKGTIYYMTAGEDPALQYASFSFPITVSAPEPEEQGGGGGGYGGGGGGDGVSTPDPEEIGRAHV